MKTLLTFFKQKWTDLVIYDLQKSNDLFFYDLGIDLEGIRSEEEMVMLEDANELRNNPNSKPLISSGGATPIHVAAAKNYTTVLK